MTRDTCGARRRHSPADCFRRPRDPGDSAHPRHQQVDRRQAVHRRVATIYTLPLYFLQISNCLCFV